MFATSMFISPLIGSNLYLSYGASLTCDIIALMDFAFGIWLMIFNCGPTVFAENKNFMRKLTSLKKRGNQRRHARMNQQDDISSDDHSQISHKYSHSSSINPRFAPHIVRMGSFKSEDRKGHYIKM